MFWMLFAATLAAGALEGVAWVNRAGGGRELAHAWAPTITFLAASWWVSGWALGRALYFTTGMMFAGVVVGWAIGAASHFAWNPRAARLRLAEMATGVAALAGSASMVWLAGVRA